MWFCANMSSLIQASIQEFSCWAPWQLHVEFLKELMNSFLEWLHRFTAPSAVYQWSVALHSCQHLLLPRLYFSHSGWCGWHPIVIWNCLFPKANGVEHPLCPHAICTPPLVRGRVVSRALCDRVVGFAAMNFKVFTCSRCYSLVRRTICWHFLPGSSLFLHPLNRVCPRQMFLMLVKSQIDQFAPCELHFWLFFKRLSCLLFI